jgi:hypothetical protein
VRVAVHFALIYQTLLALVLKSNRILDLENMPKFTSFLRLIITAKVVALPEPVGAVTGMRPRGQVTIPLKMHGQFNYFSEKILIGMLRNTAPAPRF